MNQNGAHRQPNFFCHECQKEVTVQQKEDEIICDLCGGTFLEELEFDNPPPQPQPQPQPPLQQQPQPQFPFFPPMAAPNFFPMFQPNVNSNFNFADLFNVPNPNNPNNSNQSAPQSNININSSNNNENINNANPFNLLARMLNPANVNPNNAPVNQPIQFRVVFGNNQNQNQNANQNNANNANNPQSLFNIMQQLFNRNLGGGVGDILNVLGIDDGEENFQNIVNQLFERYVCPEPPPADKEFVDKLPRKKFDHFSIDDEELNSCAVCKDDFNVGETAVELPCSHLYHEDCILPWLSKRHTCPVCRFELPQEQKKDQPSPINDNSININNSNNSNSNNNNNDSNPNGNNNGNSNINNHSENNEWKDDMEDEDDDKKDPSDDLMYI